MVYSTTRIKDTFDNSELNKDNIRCKKLKCATKQHISGFACSKVVVVNHSSYQNMWSVVRRLIGNGNRVGFDLINAQLSLLQQVCIRYGNYKHTILTNYIENRVQVLEYVQYHCNVSRDKSNTLIITVIFGGNVSIWTRECKITITKDIHPIKFVTKFHNQLQSISANMELSNKFYGYNNIFHVGMTRISGKLIKHICIQINYIHLVARYRTSSYNSDDEQAYRHGY